MIQLKVKNLGLHFDHKKVLTDCSFEIQEGDFVSIEGPVGSGKSSLLKILAQDLKQSAGNLEYVCSRNEIAYLPQFRSTAFHIPLSLKDIVHTYSPAASNTFKLLTKEQECLGWNEASGGERTLCLLEANLNCRPKVLLLDEVFSWLDHEKINLVKKTLFNFYQSEDKPSIVMVEHQTIDLPLTKTLELKGGRLLEKNG